MVICNRCIRAIRSRGERIFVGDLIIYDDEPGICTWCEESEHELYPVEAERDSDSNELERDDEFEEEHGDEI